MKLDPKIGRSLKKASPTILTCIGAAGVVATAVLAVKATPKADSLIKADSRRNHDGDPYAATKLEAVKSCWKCYIPAAATGVATIICIFGANTLNKKQQASLASAYALVNRSYSDYKHKLKELYGEDAHKKIMESIAAEKSSMPPITATGGFSNSSLEFEDANEEQRLFYDSFSKRYFQATISQVLQAEYHINRNMVLGAFVTLNDFYDFLGISHVEGGDVVGWLLSDSMYWIDFDNSKATSVRSFWTSMLSATLLPRSSTTRMTISHEGKPMKKLLICLLIFVGAIFISCNFVINATTTKTVPEQPMIQTEPLSLIIEASAPSTDILLEEEPEPTPEPEPLATREEIELLALCAMAEAEGECEHGQRLVIDSVLNRVDNQHFPDTISEVIWQKNQYAGMYGDRITRCYVMDELVKLVEEELENRTDYDVVFFNAGHYSDYGVPMFQVGNHYFSSYD